MGQYKQISNSIKMNEFLATNSRWISFAAIGAAILLGAWLFRGAYADYSVISAPAPQSRVSNTLNSQPSRQVNVNNIVRAHLFGDPNKPAAPKKVEKPKPAPAPETKLNVNLLGLIGSNDGNVARAIIKLNNGKPEVVGVGDKLGQTGAVVNAIALNEMIIERAGVKESVKLTERKKRLQSLAMKQPGNSPALFQRSTPDDANLPQASENIFIDAPPPMPSPGGEDFGQMPFDDEFANEFPDDFPDEFNNGYPEGFPIDEVPNLNF